MARIIFSRNITDGYMSGGKWGVMSGVYIDTYGDDIRLRVRNSRGQAGQHFLCVPVDSVDEVIHELFVHREQLTRYRDHLESGTFDSYKHIDEGLSKVRKALDMLTVDLEAQYLARWKRSGLSDDAMLIVEGYHPINSREDHVFVSLTKTNIKFMHDESEELYTQPLTQNVNDLLIALDILNNGRFTLTKKDNA